MLKIIIGVIIGIILAKLIWKYWLEILIAIVKCFGYLIGAILYILALPIIIFQKLTFSEENYQKRIVTLYDAIFFQDDSKKKVMLHVKSIDGLNKVLKTNKQKKQEKQVIKFLNKAKWAL